MCLNINTQPRDFGRGCVSAAKGRMQPSLHPDVHLRKCHPTLPPLISSMIFSSVSFTVIAFGEVK
jgi:hypothetical protein